MAWLRPVLLAIAIAATCKLSRAIFVCNLSFLLSFKFILSVFSVVSGELYDHSSATTVSYVETNVVNLTSKIRFVGRYFFGVTVSPIKTDFMTFCLSSFSFMISVFPPFIL